MPALSKGMPLRSSRRTLTLALTPTPTLSLDPDPYPRPKPQVRRRAARGSRAGDTALRPRRPRWGARRRPSCWARRGGGGAHLGGAGRVARAWLERSSSVAHHGIKRSAQAQLTALRATAVVSVSLALSAGRLIDQTPPGPRCCAGRTYLLEVKGFCRWRATPTVPTR